MYLFIVKKMFYTAREEVIKMLFPGEGREVPDPYYGGAGGFDRVFKLLDEACEVIANRLKDEH